MEGLHLWLGMTCPPGQVRGLVTRD